MNGWLKTRRISTVYNRVTIYYGPFKIGGIEIMTTYEVLCRATATDQHFRNMSCWSCMLVLGKNNVIIRINNAYCPTVSAIAGGPQIQQLEALTIIKTKNCPRTQFWIDLNTEI